MKLVVTGTGRCGTGYAREIFSESGARAGHEIVFNFVGRRFEDEYDVDASWLAVPYLEEVSYARVLLYRDPVRTVQSLVGTKFFETASAYRDYVYEYLPWLKRMSGDPETRASAFWAAWTEKALANVDYVVRLDDLPLRLLAELGGVEHKSLMRAVGAVSKSTNQRGRSEIEMEKLDEGMWDMWTVLERMRVREL